ncbi:MAG TPA: hypothetical protein HPP87_07140 [Planctomycetes bacterium]|nr:hypothetical protein [Planctomycetota bacterium]
MADIFGSILKGKHDTFGDAMKAGWAGSKRGREEEQDRSNRALIDARLASEEARKAYWEQQGGQSESSGTPQYMIDSVQKFRDQLAAQRELMAEQSQDTAGVDEAIGRIDKWLNTNLGLTPQPSSSRTLPGFMGVPTPASPKPDDFNTQAVKSWTKWMPPAANKGVGSKNAAMGALGGLSSAQPAKPTVDTGIAKDAAKKLRDGWQAVWEEMNAAERQTAREALKLGKTEKEIIAYFNEHKK